MKPSLAENTPLAKETVPTPPAPVVVYTFVIWDHDKGAASHLCPYGYSQEAIANMRGKVDNEDTGVGRQCVGNRHGRVLFWSSARRSIVLRGRNR